MSLVNIISAIGDTTSIYPLLVRDCGAEVPAKVVLTYNQNLKDSKQMARNAARESLIDEYGTSAIWLGGIPAVDALANYGIKKFGYNPKIDSNLLQEGSKQGLKYNIEKFKNLAPKEVKEIEKVLKNKSTFEKLLAGRFLLSTIIPTALMGYYLPKFNYALTEKLRKRQDKNIDKGKNLNVYSENKDLIKESVQSKAQVVNFKGGLISTLANMSTVRRMAITDGGLTVGRVGTARNKYEKLEKGFRMTMMMVLNFVTPPVLGVILDTVSNKLFNTNVNLDPKLLNDKDFLKGIDKMEFPKNDIIDFLDKNPQSKFAKLTEKYCGVKYLNNGVRDPRVFVNEQKIKNFQKELYKFIKQAKASKNPEKFAQKALLVKSSNILINVVVNSFLLAITLPKVTFYLRKKITGSDAEPGLVTKENV